MGKGTKNGTGLRIAFYIETFALLAVSVAVTAALVHGFSLAGKLSREAEVLSKAVHLAENVAEMASASKSGEMLFNLLNENENASVVEEDASRSTYRARYDADMSPAADGIFSVDVAWTAEEGGLVRCAVNVCWDDGAEPVYALDLAVYTGAAAIP